MQYQEQVDGDKLFTGNVKILGSLQGEGISRLENEIQQSRVEAQTVRADFDDFLESLISDSVIDVSEKRTILRKWNEITSEYPLIIQRATDRGLTEQHIAVAAYETAYRYLSNYLFGVGGVLVDMETPSTIDQDQFRNAFYEYYTAREALINGIVDKIVDDENGKIDEINEELAKIKSGELADNAITRAKLEAGFRTEHESVLSQVYPMGTAAESSVTSYQRRLQEVVNLADVLEREIAQRDTGLVIMDQRIILVSEEVTGAITRIASLEITAAEIEAIVAEFAGDHTKIAALELQADSIEASVADYGTEKAKIAQLQITVGNINSVLAELQIGGEIINVSLITQSADRIAGIVADGGYTEGGIFYPTKAYSQVQLLKDRFDVFVQGSGDDFTAASWIVTPSMIESFVSDVTVGTMIDDELAPVDARLSQIEQDAQSISLTVQSLSGTIASGDQATTERILDLIDDLQLEASSGIIITQNRIDIAVMEQNDENVLLWSRITLEADRITQEVGRAQDEETILGSRIIQEADRITAEVARAIGSESTISSQVSQQAAQISHRVLARAYNADTDTWTDTEAFMALRVALPEVMSAERRNAIAALLSASELTVFNRLYESFTAAWTEGDADFSETRYRLVASPAPADVSSMTSTFQSKGLLSSQFLLDADEVFMTGTIRGRHLEMESVSTEIFNATKARIQNLSAKSVLVDTNPNSTTDFEVEINEGSGIIVRKSGTVIFAVNPSTGKCYLHGDIDVDDGMFRGSIASGPLTLNKNPPTSSSFTISGSVVSFVNNLGNTTGLTSGRFACTGTYSGNELGAIEFVRNQTSKTYTQEEWVWSGYKSFYTVYVWTRNLTRSDVSIKLYRKSDNAKLCDYSDYYEPASSWVRDSRRSDHGEWGGGSATPAPSPNPSTALGGSVSFGSSGSLSFTASAFTFKLENLPVGYSSSYPAGTAYLDANGFLKIKT